MNIKSRILLCVIILQITGFTALLLHYNSRASDSVLEFNRQQIMAAVTASVQRLDATAAQMERTALGLARSGEHHEQQHHRHQPGHIRTELLKLLVDTFQSFDHALGGGIWYEPYIIDPGMRYFGPYAFHRGTDVIPTWELSSESYDYLNQPWYTLAIPSDWPRQTPRAENLYWTPPYFDNAGTEVLIMTVNALMYDTRQTLIGVATVDWEMAALRQQIRELKITPGTRPFLLHQNSGRYLVGPDNSSDINTIVSNSDLLTLNASQATELQEHSGEYLFAARSQTGLVLGVRIPHADLALAVQQRLADGMTINIGIAVLFVSIMALVLEFLFRPFQQILSRLQSTVDYNREASQPSFRPLQYDAENEFTPIVRVFNTLVTQVDQFTRRLSETNSQLLTEQQRVEELNATLESKVEERTRELEHKNAEVSESLRKLKLTQQQLVNLEKHAALGEVVAGLAHEINTPLGISVTAVSALEDQLKDIARQFRAGQLTKTSFDDFIQFSEEGVQITADNLRRAADLVTRFKQVAVDQSSEQRRDFELGDYLQSIVVSLRPNYKYRPIDVSVECPKRIFISSYPGAVAQIFTNLMMNSLTHAFDDNPPQRGQIRIEVQQQDQQVEVVFSDNGRGMDEDTLKQLFDPFFTTKRNQGGSGIGAYIIQDLVSHQLHGSLQVSSTPGQGTRFVIRFPLTRPAIV
ncbi:MAG: ATP-binding protein [Saccharospirillaceae bacterium]|nr:ATP-binding protein [Saccharospirillaceae bacterium]MCD8533105.1 ATP-binding protein [Saccharospirillaceae bacterium]